MAWLIWLVAVMAGLGSCRNDQNRAYWVDNLRIVKAQVTGAPMELSSFLVHVIDSQGQRVLLDDYTWDTATGSLVLRFDSAYLLPDGSTAADRLVGMGDSLPTLPSRVSALARVEVMPASLEGLTGKTAYLQFGLPFALSDLLAAGEDYQISTPLAFTEVAYRTVQLVDAASGALIVGGSVLGVVNGQLQEGGSAAMPAWQTSTYRPVAATSGADGLVKVLPLDQSLGRDSSLTVIASAPGYCTYVSGKISSTADELITIPLKVCEPLASGRLGLKAEFGSTVAVFDEQVLGATAAVAHTNTRLVPIRVDSLSTTLRGLRIMVTEGHGPDGPLNGAIPVIDLGERSDLFNFKFQSDLTVELPIIFATTGTPSGSYTIHISSVADDGSTTTAYLYGRLHTEVPSVGFASDLTVRGEHRPGIISGRSDAFLYLEASSCGAGMSLGVAVLSQAVVFAPCTAGVARFAVSDLSLPGASDELGGTLTLRTYLRDTYGNTSKDDPAAAHEREVFVDYGTPDLTTSPLQLSVDWGFAPHDSPAGSDLAPYTFPSGSLNGGSTDTVILSPATLENYAVRFPSPGACKTKVGSPADGTWVGDQGLAIVKFAVAANADSLSTVDFSDCMAGDETVDIRLSPAAMAFPALASDHASFVLQVSDAAGHLSAPKTYDVPPCPADVQTTPGTAFCWQP